MFLGFELRRCRTSSRRGTEKRAETDQAADVFEFLNTPEDIAAMHIVNEARKNGIHHFEDQSVYDVLMGDLKDSGENE